MSESETPLDIKKIPANVAHVHFEGVKLTSGRLLTRQARQLFTDVTNFDELVHHANAVRDRLMSLNVFTNVQYIIDVAENRGDLKNSYSVTYEVVERRRLNISATTMTSLDNRPSLVVQGRILNVLGVAEQLEANIHCGTNWDVARHLTLTAPLQDVPSIKTSVGILDWSSDLAWLRLLERSSGAFFGVEWPTFAGRHALKMEVAWRELTPGRSGAETVPLSMRAECGHYLKALFRHTFEKDVQDCSVLPSRGWMTRVCQEFATGGGGFQQTHLQHEMSAQWSVPLHENVETGSLISVQLSAGCGLMRSMPGSGRVSVADRFYLGGPLHMRGFQFRQMGDRTEDGTCPTGALAYGQAGAHLYSTLPWLSARGLLRDLRLHAFTNTACLSPREPMWSNRNELVALLSKETRLSVGLGIVYRLAGVARLEVNYCWPLIARCGDRVKPGLQFGIGLHYL